MCSECWERSQTASSKFHGQTLTVHWSCLCVNVLLGQVHGDWASKCQWDLPQAGLIMLSWSAMCHLAEWSNYPWYWLSWGEGFRELHLCTECPILPTTIMMAPLQKFLMFQILLERGHLCGGRLYETFGAQKKLPLKLSLTRQLVLHMVKFWSYGDMTYGRSGEHNVSYISSHMLYTAKLYCPSAAVCLVFDAMHGIVLICTTLVQETCLYQIKTSCVSTMQWHTASYGLVQAVHQYNYHAQQQKDNMLGYIEHMAVDGASINLPWSAIRHIAIYSMTYGRSGEINACFISSHVLYAA